jgi:hypothetical protein
MEVATTFRCVACCLLLSVVPCCSAQEAKIRVINGANGRPMPKLTVSVSFWYDKKYDKEIPANYDRSLTLETDGNGEAQFKFPQPPPMHFAAQVLMSSPHWYCGCAILASTDDLVRQGIVGPLAEGPLGGKDAKKFASRYKAAPGEILVIARPFSFFDRLLYALTKE